MDGQGRRGGRPSKLTPEVQATIIRHIEHGNYREVAAKAAGIPARTLSKWMKLGLEFPDGEYGKFRLLVLEAETKAETAVVEIAHVAAQVDPKWAWEYLKRKFPQRWGQDRLDLKEMRELIKLLEQRINELQGNKETPEA